MYLALSYDHRIIDGREAVSFLARIKELIEDPRFKTKKDRVANNDALSAILAGYFKTNTNDHWFKLIDAEGIPCGPVMDHVQVYNDPQTQARDMVAEVDHPSAGKTKTLGVHIKLRGTPGAVARPGRKCGPNAKNIQTDGGNKRYYPVKIKSAHRWGNRMSGRGNVS